ncbi:Pao retrotransposon peptidase family protein, partial [Aphelenchoides avenae]
MDSSTKPERIEASPTPPQCLAHTADTEGAKSSYVAHTAATDAGGAGEAQEVLSVSPPPPPPGIAPSSTSGKDDQKRSTSKRDREKPSQSGKPTAGKSRREPKQFTSHAAFPAVPAGSAFHRTHRLETWEACIDQLRPRSTTDAQPSCRRAPATDALRASQPRRRPRADPFDQKLTAPRRCSSDANEASKSSSATHCHATRAAQEPLEPLAPATKLRLASPSPCAFCGNDHVSYVCDVYKSVAQRLGRTRHLERCFSCLGQGHHSSSCSKKDAVCSICRSGHHHEAFCRLAVASFALPAPCSGPPVPAPADTAPRMPTTRSARLKTLTTASHAAVALVTRRSSHKPSTTPDVNNNRRICAFCQSAHWTQKCTAFASVSQRLNRVRKLRLCFVCLQAGHSVSSCPSAAKPCKFCSNGSHHRALCCRDVLSHSTNAHVDGTHRKKRSVKATGIGIRAKNRNFCPPKNETICFCDAFVFHQFVRHLRPEVCLIPAPMFTSADAANVVCSFRPTSEVKRMLFWFSSDQVSLSHTELVHLVIQLSRYYTEYYESILQYVVVSPSKNSRRDIWTYGIF